VSLLIPAYNEESTIESVVGRSLATLAECTDDFELIILDDASRDRTPSLLAELQARNPRITILRHETNRGIAATFEELYRAATKDFLFLVSGDGQYPPEALKDCMPLLGDCDIVICNRTYKHYTPYRHLISKCYRLLPRLLFGVELYDSGSIKCVRRSIIREIPVESRSVFVEAERLIRAHKRSYKIGKVDIVQAPRAGGKARGAELSTVWHSTWDMLRLWWKLQILRAQP